jgi:hypothetical protein
MRFKERANIAKMALKHSEGAGDLVDNLSRFKKSIWCKALYTIFSKTAVRNQKKWGRGVAIFKNVMY